MLYLVDCTHRRTEAAGDSEGEDSEQAHDHRHSDNHLCNPANTHQDDAAIYSSTVGINMLMADAIIIIIIIIIIIFIIIIIIIMALRQYSVDAVPMFKSNILPQSSSTNMRSGMIAP